MDSIDYKALFEQSSASVVVMDTDFTVLAVSDAFATATKTIREDIVGRNIFDVFPDNPHDSTANGENTIRASLNRVLTTKTPDRLAVVRYDIPNPESEHGEFITKYWRPRHSPVLDELNNVKYIIQQAEDVTENEVLIEQIEAEKKIAKILEDSEKRYNMMLMRSPFAFAILKGKDMVVTLANDSIKALWKKGAEIEGKPLIEVLPEIKNTSFPELLEYVYTSGLPYYGDEILAPIDNNGTLEDTYFNFVYQPYLEADETISGVTIIAYEATARVIVKKALAEQREAEKKMLKSIEESNARYYGMLMESPFAFSVMKGKDMVITLANSLIKEFWGKGTDVEGKTLLQVLPELKDQPFPEMIEKVYTTGIPVYANEILGKLTYNGQLKHKYFNVVFQPYYEADNSISGVTQIAYDVTELVLARKKIEESEHEIREIKEQLELSIKTGRIGVWFWDVKKDILTWNEEQKEIYGFSASEVITSATQFNSLIVPEDLKRIQEDQSAGTTIEHEYDFRIIRKHDGELRWIKSRARNTLDQQGTLQYISGVNIDITDQVIALNKIQASEQRFRLLVQQAPVAICILRGEEHVIEIINEEMSTMLGRTMEEALNKPIFDLLTELKGQGFQQLVDTVRRTGERLVAQESPITLQRNGKLDHAFIKFVYEPLREADGSVSGIMVLADEITEQVLARKAIEESEKKFRLLTNAMPQKITNADADGNVLFFNRQWTDDTGLTFEELVNGGWEKAMHPEDLATTVANWQHSITTGEVFNIECRIQNKQGKYRWHLSRAVPVRDENGKILMWVGSNTDIQEQKEQKEALEMAVQERTKELEHANKELAFQNSEKEQRAAELSLANNELAFQNSEKEQRATELSLANLHLVVQNEEKEQRSLELTLANKELESFTYVSSHDLQEPLNKIQMFAGRILESEHHNLSDKGKDHFQRIQNAAARMQQLIQDLLAYSNTSITERTFEKTDLNLIIEEVKTQLEDAIQEKHATIEATELCEVSVIPFQFRQLMYNIMSNALKFSRPDVPPHIVITSIIKTGKELNNTELLPEEKYCHISIRDNGIGFESQYREKIFEVFQRLHGKEQYSGTGIGLAIVKKIVDNHNGIITATSELGSGATFDMYLPT
jgi:PAS domain S-box-containing protein